MNIRTEMNKSNFYVCRRMKLKGFLNEKGFREIKVRPDRKNPMFFVWIFKDSTELQDAVSNYYNSKF